MVFKPDRTSEETPKKKQLPAYLQEVQVASMLALTKKIASGVSGSSVSRSERSQVVNKRGNIETVPHRDQMHRNMHNWIIKQRKV